MTELEKLQHLFAELRCLSRATIQAIGFLDEDQLLSFANRREEIVKAMEPYRAYVTDEMREQIATLLLEEQVILNRMTDIRTEAADWLKLRSGIRVQQNAYQSIYDADSIFIDYRK